jgi:hypothetical protein
MAIATVVFWMGRDLYVHVPPSGKEKSSQFFAIFFYALFNLGKKKRGESFLEVAKGKFPADKVDGAKAAVDVFGPKDFTANYAFWKAQVDGAAPGAATAAGLMQLLETATGGTPQTKPEEYKKRSPLQYIADLDKFPGAYMAVHGGKDVLVTVQDTCRTAAVLKNAKSYHLNGSLAVVTSEPPGCEGTNVTWLAGPKPTTAWPENRYALIYDAAGHEIATASGQAMFADTLFYLVAKVP